MALNALGERLMLWLRGHTLPLTMAGMVFAAYWRVLPDPSMLQLIGLGMFSLFALVLLLIRRA